MQKAGLAGRIRHGLRRTAVRNLERACIPRSVAMAMVGHRAESIYRRYAIADEAMLKESVVKLAALHASNQAAKESSTLKSPRPHRLSDVFDASQSHRGRRTTSACNDV
jgi:hypothetical protein